MTFVLRTSPHPPSRRARLVLVVTVGNGRLIRFLNQLDHNWKNRFVPAVSGSGEKSFGLRLVKFSIAVLVLGFFSQLLFGNVAGGKVVGAQVSDGVYLLKFTGYGGGYRWKAVEPEIYWFWHANRTVFFLSFGIFLTGYIACFVRAVVPWRLE